MISVMHINPLCVYIYTYSSFGKRSRFEWGEIPALGFAQGRARTTDSKRRFPVLLHSKQLFGSDSRAELGGRGMAKVCCDLVQIRDKRKRRDRRGWIRAGDADSFGNDKRAELGGRGMAKVCWEAGQIRDKRERRDRRGWSGAGRRRFPSGMTRDELLLSHSDKERELLRVASQFLSAVGHDA